MLLRGLAVLCHDKLPLVSVNQCFWLRVSYAGVLRRAESEWEREHGKCFSAWCYPWGGRYACLVMPLFAAATAARSRAARRPGLRTTCAELRSPISAAP